MNEQEFKSKDSTVDQSRLPGIARPNLNLASNVAQAESNADANATRYPDPTQPKVLISMDIESLALGPRPVITEIALLGYDLEEGELLPQHHVHNYPVEPQQALIPPREIHLGTLIARADWTHSKGIDFGAELKKSASSDFEDLASLCRNFVAVFHQLTQNGKVPYELVCARPQFDAVAVESLLKEVGLIAPWGYDTVIDVRTMLKRAGINHKNVPWPKNVTPHMAWGDARWQIDQYLAAVRG